MRLRTTLVLAFVSMAALQVAVVAPFAWNNVGRILERQQQRQTEQALRVVTAEYARWQAQLHHTMDELLNSQATEDLTFDVVKASISERSALSAKSLMAARGLEVLAILDSNGKTLSSGHVPARIGEPADPLFAQTLRPLGSVDVVNVELTSDEGLLERPALVSARPLVLQKLQYWLVGGIFLNDDRAQTLSQIAGAAVDIRFEQNAVATSGTHPSPAVRKQLSVSPNVDLTLDFSTEDIARGKQELMRAVILLAGVGLLFSLGAALWLSRRLTGPVEALTAAAMRIARGEPGVTVEGTARSVELKTLVQTFNRMTRELKETNDRLLASERVAAWQEVARRLAHEIKNPLTPIRMSLETLLAASQREQLDAQFKPLFKEGATAMLEEVERLRRIVDEFSQFARLPKAILEPLNLTAMLAQVMSLYKNQPTLTYVFEGQQQIAVKGDRHQLTQIVVNLIKNAEEALSSQPQGTIRVRLAAAGGDAQVDVIDDGPGIDLGIRSRLFEPYVTSKPNGTGLGLALALRMAQEHHGQLMIVPVVDSGVGSCFRLTLPLIADSHELEAS
jgi:two-component system, NtrC family, nitrogen regulation sensor histidine kinase NtrY